jgi:hypothetical protein
VKGRAVPPPEAFYSRERIAHARAMKERHQREMEATAASLPVRVVLGDGRVLDRDQPFAGGYAYRCADGLAVIASYDPTPHGTLLHLSASYAKRLPRWRDLRLLRAAFFPPDVDVIQVLPRDGEYVHAHPFCLHLFQAPGDWQGGWNV